ncbi:MAG: hypothetical protein J7497_10205 [Chitinophagaceae bacterium]|nr:hypothetical protein [Chitinophagaceae bacterium]
MKSALPKIFISLLFFALSFNRVNAQSDSAFASQRALLFADSLIKSFQSGNFNQYLSISYPGVIKYYGGKHQFTEYIQQARAIESAPGDEQIEIFQILNNKNEWQCVVKKKNETVIDGKHAVVVSYLVGQSKDEGNTWKYVDVAYNPVNNVVQIMPDVFEKIAVPQRQIIFQ